MYKGYVSTSHGQVHYRTTVEPGATASRAVPVIYLHQTASSSAMYEKVMAQMREAQPGRAAYALDTPGFGGSFDPDGMPSMPDYGRYLTAAIDALDIERYHVFGHHTGACIAAELISDHPARVASAGFIGPVPLTKDERDEFRKHFSEPMSPTDDGSYLQQTWDYLVGLGSNHLLDLHHRELLDTVRAYHGRFQAYSAVWDQDWTALYETMTCPLLIMCAEDDVLWPFFARAQELKPAAKAAVIKGANFEPDLDPEGVVNAYARFLTEIDPMEA